MKVFVIGNGGREHAIAWKLSRSEKVSEIHSTPKNVGIAGLGRCADIAVENIEALASYAEKNNIDLTVVGPEIPLSLGVVDHFRKKNLPVFGPTKAAARIESSKGFAKDLMAKYRIPTASYRRFNSAEGLEEYVRRFDRPPVIKADGLAAGKGVLMQGPCRGR